MLYSFYKNFLYVTTQYWFGFYSVFSGQVLYEKAIYQLFNITFTSWPIIWFAVWDREYDKDTKEEENKLLEDLDAMIQNLDQPLKSTNNSNAP